MSKYPKTPTEKFILVRRQIRTVVLIVLLVGISAWIYAKYFANRVTTYVDITDHFKYGSIGSDLDNGLPIEILKVLPIRFAKSLPEGEKSPRDLTAFGFIQEPGHELPNSWGSILKSQCLLEFFVTLVWLLWR